MVKRTSPKKAKRGPKKYAGKTEKEWNEWGARFGKGLDAGGKAFADDMEDLAEKINDHVEAHQDRWSRRFDERMRHRMERHWGRRWWYGTFGIIAPLLGSIMGLIALLLGVLILNLVNAPIQSAFLPSVTAFILANLPLFFGMSLLLGYARYAAGSLPGFWIFQPFITSAGLAFGFWVAASILVLLNNPALTSLTNAYLNNIPLAFILFLALTYPPAIIRRIQYEDDWKDR